MMKFGWKTDICLFNKYCFPSLKLQSCTDFLWLVFFDGGTPSEYKKRNEDLQQELQNFRPVYVTSFKDFEKELPNQIRKYIDEQTKYIITTRLDNDDAFHKDTVGIIQKNFHPIDKAIIDLKNGLTLQVGEQHKLSVKDNITSGPFVSLIELLKDDEQMLTVYDREHLKWVGDAEFINVEEGHYWLQIIHERNISNDLGQKLTFNKTYLNGYEFLDKVKFSFRYYIFIIFKGTKLLGFIKKIKQR